MQRAIIYIPPGVDLDTVNRQYTTYCEAMKLEIAAFDLDDPFDDWWETLRHMKEHRIDAFLAADPKDVPAGLSPRIEIADLSMIRPDLTGAPVPPRRRRPRPT